jgi:hypothetical protein
MKSKFDGKKGSKFGLQYYSIFLKKILKMCLFTCTNTLHYCKQWKSRKMTIWKMLGNGKKKENIKKNDWKRMMCENIFCM